MSTESERNDERTDANLGHTRAGIPDIQKREERGDIPEPREVSLDPLLADQGVGLDRLNLHAEAATTQPMVGEQTDPASLSPEEQAVRDEFRIVFLRNLARLPQDQREALLLHTRDGLSVEQVAQQEGVSADEARRRIEAAEQTLRDGIGQEYEGDDLPTPELLYEALEDISLDDETLNLLIDRVSDSES